MSEQPTPTKREWAVAEVIARAMKPFEEEMRRLKEKLREAELREEQRERAREAEPTMKYCDVWQTGREYSFGDVVTHQGSAWVCRRTTMGRPNEDFAGWQLIVKRGAAK